MTTSSPTTAPARAAVTLHTVTNAFTLDVEVADTDTSRERGLMYRRSMPQDHGMLFIFPDEVMRTFWMKNTYLPLDLIFISGALRVVGVVHHAEPLTLAPRAVAVPSRYVVEVNAGLARRLGVDTDTVVTFSGLPPARP